MTELLQRSRIKRAQELDAVVDVVGGDAILRHERNGLAIANEEIFPVSTNPAHNRRSSFASANRPLVARNNFKKLPLEPTTGCKDVCHARTQSV